MAKPKKKQRKYNWEKCPECGIDFIKVKKGQQLCDICAIMKGVSKA